MQLIAMNKDQNEHILLKYKIIYSMQWLNSKLLIVI